MGVSYFHSAINLDYFCIRKAISMVKPTLLILAAGIGSRYGGFKQLEAFGPNGETIIDYSVFDALRAGFGKIIFVIRRSIEKDFADHVLGRLRRYIAVDYVLQENDYIPEGFALHPERNKPWGTGHAVLMAQHKITGPFAVINADDYYGTDAFVALSGFLSFTVEKHYAMVAYKIENTLSEFGTVSRGVCSADSDGMLVGITERTKIYRNNGQIVFEDDSGTCEIQPNTVVSMNCWGFTPDFFDHLASEFSVFLRTNADPLKGEFYLPSVVNKMIYEGKTKVRILTSAAEWFGITYHNDKPLAVKRLEQLHLAGVYPEPLWQ